MIRIGFGSSLFLGLACVLMSEAVEGGDLGGGGGEPVVAPSVKVEGGDPAKPIIPEVKPGEVKEQSDLDKAGFAEVEGDPGLTYTLNFLAKNGFNSETPSVTAALQGDFSLLKAELAQKGAAGWEQAVALAEKSWENHSKELEAMATEVGGIVTGVAERAGVDWEQAVAHVGASAKPEERTALNSLLGNPKTAHIAAAFITSAFIESGDGEYTPAAKAVSEGAPAQSGGGAGGPLSRAQFTKEMAKLRESMGDSYISSPQAKALHRRLQA